MAEDAKVDWRKRKRPNRLVRAFFMAYRDSGSDTYLDPVKSAVAAGYCEKLAYKAGWRLLKRYSSKESQEELKELCNTTQVEAVAVLGATLSSRHGKGANRKPDKLALIAARSVAAMNGLPTSDAVAVEQHNQTIHVDKLLLIGEHGMDAKKLRLLTTGGKGDADS